MYIIDRIEADLEELRKNPDLIINRAYVLYALHDLPGVSRVSAETARNACENIAHRCLESLCPPLAAHPVGMEVCLLIHLNVDRSLDEIAQIAGRAWGERISENESWSGDYSAVGVSEEDTVSLADAIAQGDIQVLSWFDYGVEE